MAKRAVELLNLPKGKSCLLLDIGCGSAISSEQISREGHVWFGCDISRAMLELAKNRSSSKGDLAEVDMGVGIPCRSGSFDGAISISAVQWLCVKQTPSKKKVKMKRLKMSVGEQRGTRQNPDQMNAILAAAKKAGFDGGLVVDYPRSMKAKKFYLCLWKRDTKRAKRDHIWSSINGTTKKKNMKEINMVGTLSTYKNEANKKSKNKKLELDTSSNTSSRKRNKKKSPPHHGPATTTTATVSTSHLRANRKKKRKKR
eukprot:jgi/Bigna1/83346/fgenesh1_pg.106_\